jgi:hypothetical protein
VAGDPDITFELLAGPHAIAGKPPARSTGAAGVQRVCFERELLDHFRLVFEKGLLGGLGRTRPAPAYEDARQRVARNGALAT